MKEKRNILSVLMIGLIYPAILGSIIYTFFDVFIYYSLNGNTTGFLEQNTLTIFLKISLLFLILIFFSLDYIYSSWTKKINLLNFIIDIMILVGLYQAFFLIKLNSKELLPDFTNLNFTFFWIFLLYVIWDIVAFYNRKIPYFKEMAKWEFLFLTLFLLNGFLTKIYLTENFGALTTIPLIGLSVYFFIKHLKIREESGI